MKSHCRQSAQAASKNSNRQKALLFIGQTPNQPRQKARPKTSDFLPIIQLFGTSWEQAFDSEYRCSAASNAFTAATPAWRCLLATCLIKVQLVLRNGILKATMDGFLSIEPPAPNLPLLSFRPERCATSNHIIAKIPRRQRRRMTHQR